MNRLKFILAWSTCLLLISGCSKDEAGIGTEDNALKGNEMEMRNLRTTEQQRDTQFGYVRYNENQIDINNQELPSLDREALANVITRTLLHLPDIEEAATLVTDREVLIAYTKADDVERGRAADSVKRTAYSILPVWFHVYLSDQPTAYRDLQSYGNNHVTETGDDKGIHRLIERFQSESPQGGNYTEGANDNP